MRFALVTIPAKTVRITRCYHECPYFTLEGGPGPVMVCAHPTIKERERNGDIYAGMGIISHPDCTTGFPKKCPLRDAKG